MQYSSREETKHGNIVEKIDRLCIYLASGVGFLVIWKGSGLLIEVSSVSSRSSHPDRNKTDLRLDCHYIQVKYPNIYFDTI